MLLRRCHCRKNGKVHTCWALVESYRTARGSRQRGIAYVGELQASEPNGWVQLGRRLESKARPQPSLFDPLADPSPALERIVEVSLGAARFERRRGFGAVWPALGLWRLLGLDTLLAEQVLAGRAAVPWATVAAILTSARVCTPGSSSPYLPRHGFATRNDIGTFILLEAPRSRPEDQRSQAGPGRL